MANSPRKPGSVRKPSPAPDADDLFSAPNEPPAAAPDEWTLEDGEPSGKPESFPSGVSLPMAMPLPAPGSVRMSPIAAPEAASFESNPRPVAGALPEVVPPASPAAPRSAPAPPTPPLPDPFEIEDDLPTVAVKPVSLPVVDPFDPPSEASEETYSKPDGLEIESTPLLAIAPRPPANRAGLLAAATLLLGLLGSFFAVLYINRPEAVTSASRPEPVLPLKGQITTLTAIESGWRTRQPGDQASTVDVTLPVPSRQQAALLPMIRITTGATTATGFLRFIFINPEGKISGDVRVLKVSAGTIDPLSSGAKVSSAGTATIFGSLGFMDRPGFVAYATSASPRWSVEVSESTQYNAKEEGWSKLDTFDLRNSSDP